MLKEFRDFINRGNLVDLAVAFVMGVAFSSVVSALTDRIVSPLIGMIFNLENLERVWMFGDPLEGGSDILAGSVGAFLQALLNFVIVAFVMFLVVKAYNTAKARAEQEEEEGAPPEPAEDIVLLREIRDSLGQR